MRLEPASIDVSIRSHFQTWISLTPVGTNKFCLKQYWGGGKAALLIWPDRIRSLVSMAKDSSHKVIMGEML